MTAAWNDTFTEQTDWSSVEFQQMFVSAVNERYARLLGNEPLPNVAEGDDVQSAERIATVQAIIDTTIVGNFIDPSWDGDFEPEQPPALTWAAVKDAVLDGNDWTRKIPAEVNIAAYEGYPVVVEGDQYASNVVDELLVPGSVAVNQFDGLRVVLSADPGADPPELSWAPTDELPTLITRYGRMSGGDYIGPWVWTELRDTLNYLTVRKVAATWPGPVGMYSAASWQTPLPARDTWSEAKSAAEGNQAGGSIFFCAYSGGLKTSGKFLADAQRSYGQATIASSGSPALAREAAAYLRAMAAPAVASPVFDANGDDVTEGAYRLMGNAASTTATVYVQIGNPSLPLPAWCDEPGAESTGRGWQMYSIYGTENFAVEGGFAYRPG